MEKHSLHNWYNNNKQTIKWSIAACLVILFYYVIMNVSQVMTCVDKITNVLSPFIFGIVLAYLLRPVCNLVATVLKKVKFMRNSPKLVNLIAVLCAYIFGASVVTVFCLAIVPPLTNSIINLIHYLPTIGRNVVDYIESIAKENETLRTVVNELYARISVSLKTDLMPNVTEIVDFLTASATNLWDILKTIFIGFIISVYLLADKARLKTMIAHSIETHFSPRASKAICSELQFVDKTFTRYITGTLCDALIVGIITYIFGLITGLPSPILLAATIAVTNVIPIVGPFIGAIPTALIVLAYTPDKFVMYCIYLLILQQLDGHILVPKILGSAVGISGLTALFAIIVGGGLFGVPGMILGVPVVTVCLDIAKKVIVYHKDKKQKEAQANEKVQS